MIEDFDNKKYEEYLKIISDDLSILNYKNGWVYHKNYKIKPPKLISISERIKFLKNERLKKYEEYHDVYNNIIDSSDPEKYKIKYDILVNDINKISDNIHSLNQLSKFIPHNKRLETEFVNLQNEKDEIVKKLLRKNEIKEHLDLKEKLNDIEEKLKYNKLQPHIDYYIDKLPDLNNVEAKDDNKTKKYKNISNKQAETIKINVKNLINKEFKFSSLDECLSTKKAPYWMSKDEIIEQIDNSEIIKSKMPKNFKKLKKNELCSAIENLRKS